MGSSSQCARSCCSCCQAWSKSKVSMASCRAPWRRRAIAAPARPAAAGPVRTAPGLLQRLRGVPGPGALGIGSAARAGLLLRTLRAASASWARACCTACQRQAGFSNQRQRRGSRLGGFFNALRQRLQRPAPGCPPHHAGGGPAARAASISGCATGQGLQGWRGCLRGRPAGAPRRRATRRAGPTGRPAFPVNGGHGGLGAGGISGPRDGVCSVLQPDEVASWLQVQHAGDFAEQAGGLQRLVRKTIHARSACVAPVLLQHAGGQRDHRHWLTPLRLLERADAARGLRPSMPGICRSISTTSKRPAS